MLPVEMDRPLLYLLLVMCGDGAAIKIKKGRNGSIVPMMIV